MAPRHPAAAAMASSRRSSCRLRGFKPSKHLKCFKGPCHAQLRTQTLPQQASRHTLQAKATPTGTRQGHNNGAITAFNYGHSRLPFAKSQTPKSFKWLSNFCHAICYYRRSKLPFAHPQRPKTLRSSFDQALEATAICYYRRSKLPFAGPQRPKTLCGSFDQALRPQPSATIGVRGD